MMLAKQSATGVKTWKRNLLRELILQAGILEEHKLQSRRNDLAKSNLNNSATFSLHDAWRNLSSTKVVHQTWISATSCVELILREGKGSIV